MTWWQVKAKGESRAELSIYGDIGESWWGESVTAKECCKEIAKIEADTIDVRINSYGGAVADGLAIYNALQRHSATIVTHNDGVAMSIASLIFMAGSERHSAENALFMIHAPWGVASGNAADMREMADILDKYAEGMISAYRASGLSTETIRGLLTDGKDHFYTATEAQADGFVTDVTAALPIAAQFTLNRFTRPRPPNLGVHTMADSGNTAAAPEQPAAPVVSVATSTPNIAAIEAAAEARALARIQARNEEFDRQIAPIAKKMPHLADLVASLRGNVSVTVEAAGQQILAKMAESGEPLMTARVQPGIDARDHFRAGASKAIQARMGVLAHDPGNPYRGQSLIQVAGAALEASGVSARGMTPTEIASKVFAAHSTSDFPYLLQDAINKKLQAAYGAVPSIWRRIANVGQVSDFKTINLLKMGSFNSLVDKPEGGEYQAGTFSEEREQMAAKTKGRYVAMTREMLINDDLAAFNRLGQMLGQAAARTVNADVVSILTANPTMADTVALFHASHNNLAASGTVISVAALSAARAAMRKQKDPSGLDYTNIMPSLLVVPVVLEEIAHSVVTSTSNTDANGSLKNNFIRTWGALDIISDPLLDAASATSWYMVTDPNIAPLIEIAFLDGVETPYTESEAEFMTDAMRWKVRMDYGVAANDWRAGYKNPGA
jgi:ATP-dependent protease ClpP protease subunit